MIEVNIHEAKTQLSRLIAKVEQGEEVIIARAGEPVAKLIRADQPKRSRKLGEYAGKIWIADDFDAPLDPETFEPER
ncbi:MAG TPA: type II toxin-antitoxin system prevent-host-death family antitoxin [Thermoanaerobaculia bacterium]|jgi:prevent-host-death family protein